LREFGVDTIFGVPGGANAPLLAALMDRPDVRMVTAKHESNAAFMAMGYALATGRPGVIYTTAGPGITNAMTGIACAYYEGVPVVHIAGEVARSAFGRGALQESSPESFDAVGMMRRFTKASVLISRAGQAATLVRKTIETALGGRPGPVFISMPLDVASTQCAPQPVRGTTAASVDIPAAACAHAMELLERAERPLILAGAGARGARSKRALRALAEHIGAPVCVTPKGKGVFPEDHSSYIGVLGFGGHDSVIQYLERGVDVLLVIGSSLNDFSTNSWTPLLRATHAFLQIDIDAAQLGKNYPIDVGLLGPADVILSQMLDHRGRSSRCARPLNVSLLRQPVAQAPSGRLTTTDVVLALNDLCPDDAIHTADMGEHLAIALHYLSVGERGEFFASLGFGSMGSGIVSAIGYQLGAPERRTYALCGDGGMLMNGSEVATAVQWELPTTFLVVNDSRLNMVWHGMRDLYGRSPSFDTQEIDFAAWARSMGADAEIVRTRSELCSALRIVPQRRPRVLDLRIDPDVRLTGSQRNVALRQFAAKGSDA